MRKSRSDSVLDSLPADQQAALERWLCEVNISYEQAQERLLEQYAVTVSKSALVKFFQVRKREAMLETIADNAHAAQAIQSQLAIHSHDSFDALLQMIGQSAFEMKMRGEELPLGSLKDLAEIAALGLKAKTDARKIDQKDNEIAIAKGKFQLELEKYQATVAEQKRKITDALTRSKGGLTPETLRQIEEAASLL